MQWPPRWCRQNCVAVSYNSIAVKTNTVVAHSKKLLGESLNECAQIYLTFSLLLLKFLARSSPPLQCCIAAALITSPVVHQTQTAAITVEQDTVSSITRAAA